MTKRTPTYCMKPSCTAIAIWSSDICQYPAAALSVPIAYELAELRDYHLSSRSTSPAPGFYFAPPADRSIPPATQVIGATQRLAGTLFTNL